MKKSEDEEELATSISQYTISNYKKIIMKFSISKKT